MATRRELASYARPPLTEVVLSVQFEPIPDFNVAVLGQVWAAFRDNFPQVKHYPPIAPEIERVGIVLKQGTDSAFVSEYPPPRLWFLDALGQELIQVQSDRFVRNWRKTSDNDAYPRYEKHIRPLFVRDYQLFLRFLEKQGIGPLVPNQCEVTYLNMIPLENVARPFQALDQVLRFLTFKPIEIEGLHFQDAGCNFNHTIEDEDGTFQGRVRVSAGPAIKRTDGSPAITLNLTARGQPIGSGIEGVLGFFDLGRRYIIEMFEAITTQEMQEKWGRLNVRE